MTSIIERSLNISIKNLSITAILGAFTATLAIPLPVKALTFVTERAALEGNDQVDWSSLGQVFNPLSPNPSTFLPDSFSAKSSLGLGLNVNIPLPPSPDITPPFVFQTSFPPKGIPTNFSNGNFLLFTGLKFGVTPAIGNPGPITITFDQPIKAAGTQIAVDDTPQFTAFISAFDSNNNLLGTFSTAGTSSTALDNSATFLGVSSDIPNIKQLVFSSSVNRALAINTLSIAAVPEATSTLGLLLIGILGTGLTFRRQFNKGET